MVGTGNSPFDFRFPLLPLPPPGVALGGVDKPWQRLKKLFSTTSGALATTAHLQQANLDDPATLSSAVDVVTKSVELLLSTKPLVMALGMGGGGY